MQVREASKTDILQLKRLLIQLGYPEQDETEILLQLERHRKEDYRLLVAEIDQEVVAFIALHCIHVFHKSIAMGRITAFCVDEHVRGQGIGIQLLQAAETWFRSMGCNKVEVTSNNKRSTTHQFYRQRGYTEESKRFSKLL